MEMFETDFTEPSAIPNSILVKTCKDTFKKAFFHGSYVI
jgi:hypothetical protein